MLSRVLFGVSLAFSLTLVAQAKPTPGPCQVVAITAPIPDCTGKLAAGTYTPKAAYDHVDANTNITFEIHDITTNPSKQVYAHQKTIAAAGGGEVSFNSYMFAAGRTYKVVVNLGDQTYKNFDVIVPASNND